MAFKPTDILFARATRYLRLSTKQTKKGFYKGTRSSGIGQFSWYRKRWNIYEINYEKVRTYVVPEKKALEDCQLEPFVAVRVRKPAAPNRKLTGKMFMEEVKADGSEIKEPE